MAKKEVEFKITFQPSGRSVFVLPGTTLFEAAARAGLLLQSPCGGKGTCGKCRVRLTKGACEASSACRQFFSKAEIEQGWRLACQARVCNHSIVEIPQSSLFESTSRILTAAGTQTLDVRPAVWKKYVELPTPTMEDDSSDVHRIERAAGSRVKIGLDLLRTLPRQLRDYGLKGTAVVCCDHLVAFEPGDTAGRCFGVAFDLGTTTIVGCLMDLKTGTEIAVAAGMNPQISLGDDVISRILQVRENAKALEELRSAAVSALNELIAELVAKAGVAREEIYEATAAGNTTMQHLLLGISPAALGEVPFPPVFQRGLFLRAADAGIQIHPQGSLYVFPNIGGFVGGDTVAGILAATLHLADKPLLFVDIGTNGEIVLAVDGKLYAASTAAGPAFEGARIRDGMRATDGAIEKVVVRDGDIACNVIGNTLPAGLCGTGLIDLTAELLRLGVIDSTGRILSEDELGDSVSAAIRARLISGDNGTDFRIAAAAESKTGRDVCLYQRDVRELQLASGAMRAGVIILLRQAGLDTGDIHEVLLAGGFGNFIRRSNARRIGLLPAIPRSRIHFVGNASAMGAKAVLLSQEVRQLADDIASRAKHIDLSSDPEFQLEFGMAMMFPEDEPQD
jgi:uncharacterized 2Fe-2S/4Fe-4S cluster protein (DUF4445 family)